MGWGSLSRVIGRWHPQDRVLELTHWLAGMLQKHCGASEGERSDPHHNHDYCCDHQNLFHDEILLSELLQEQEKHSPCGSL